VDPAAGSLSYLISSLSHLINCSVACPLTCQGGAVQHNPQIHLLLWGPGWYTDPNQIGVATYLVSFYTGLGVAPQDTFSTITSQYGDSTGSPSFGSPAFAGAYVDVNPPPSGVTGQEMAAEVDAFASTVGITGCDHDRGLGHLVAFELRLKAEAASLGATRS
jgi:hypothetical protein